LETKFGGNLRIEEDECWPPRIYGSDFESKVGRKMLTEEEYRLKYENGELKRTKVYEPFVKVPVLVTEQKIYMQIEDKREVNAEFALSPPRQEA
jgi:hypothetical protein